MMQAAGCEVDSADTLAQVEEVFNVPALHLENQLSLPANQLGLNIFASLNSFC